METLPIFRHFLLALGTLTLAVTTLAQDEDNASCEAGADTYYEIGAERFARLSEIEVPTIVVHGEEDPLVPLAAAEEIAERVNDAELRTLSGYAHDLPVELVPEFVDAIQTVAERAPTTR